MKFFKLFILFVLSPFLVNGENVQQKVVLITGCSSGIGFHTAVHLANRGFKVYAGLLDPNQDGERLKLTSISPQNLIPVKLDVCNSQHIANIIEQVTQQEDRIDVLVNNAAYGLFGPVDACTMEEIEHQFRVNLFGAIELTHAVIPHFRQQSFGRIICISSIRAFKSSSVQGVYSATKSALEAIGESWASTLFPWNIHVTLVEPGATATAFPDNMIFGSFYKNKENPYPNILENSLAFVHAWNNDGDRAQNPKEIALLIERLIENPSPPLRMQTNQDGVEEVRRFSNDPTGAVWLQEEQELVKGWSCPSPVQ